MAVPIFFMTTGYFYSATKKKHRELLQIRKIGGYFLYANALFLVFQLGIHVLKYKTLAGFFAKFFSADALLKFLLLNHSPFQEHLWYLGAILYALAIVYFVDRHWGREKLYPAIPFLLVADLVLGKYSRVLLGMEFPYILVRNFLFVGLPYVLIGDLLAKRSPQFKSRTLLFAAVLFALTALLEPYLLDSFGMNTARKHNISTTFLALSVFLLALNSRDLPDNRLYQWCCFAGKHLSLNIYILHPIFIFLYTESVSLIHNEVVRSILLQFSPLPVFGISIAASWVLHVLGKQRSA